MNEAVVEKQKVPYLDFSYQFNLSRERVEKKVFTYLCEISEKLYKEKRKCGALVVIGHFDGNASNMKKMTNGQVEKYVNIIFPQFEEDIKKLFESNEDGAIIFHQSGQLLATNIYLHVENCNVEIFPGGGTRHITSASVSTREDVCSVVTLSEETGFVRLWKDGAFVEQFQPNEGEDKVETEKL